MAFYSKFTGVMTKVLLVIAGLALLVMMVIVVGNSMGRAFFRIPIFGTIEVAGLAGVIVVAVAVGYSQREGRNIVVDTVASHFAPRTRAIFDACTLFLSLLVVVFFGWVVFRDALSSWTLQETTLTTGVSTVPFKFAWTIGIVILCMYLVQHMIEAIRKGGKK
jgi:TRAP-type C4-dicarboxylate transport system permease small subunit